jgi:alkylation response protein AidB-like acyl-CoA dehydrogenase
LQAVRAQRAIACRAPSLAVATTMHHFTIATVLEADPEDPGREAELLGAVAGGNLYVASGFAEGRTGASIQTSALCMELGPDGIILNGSKKPCSLSRSMDLFTVSTPPPEGMDAGLAAVLIPADTPGLERRPFWQSPILAGAESDEVILHDVCVGADAFFPLGGSGRQNSAQDRGFVWFELLSTACYLGMASALVERVLLSERGGAAERVSLATEVEGAMAALEGVARAMRPGEAWGEVEGAMAALEGVARAMRPGEAWGNDELARMLLVRYAVHGAIDRTASLAVELLGGLAFIRSPEVSYLLAAVHVLPLHPPPRLSAAKSLNQYLLGSPLVLD